MAKKKTKKKVNTKLHNGLAKGKSEEEVLDEMIDEMSDEEVDEIIDASAGQESPSAVSELPEDERGGEAKSGLPARMFEKVRIRIPVHLKIAKRQLQPGINIVERHQVPVIREMVSKKMSADFSIFTGKNYLVRRLLDRSLRIEEVSQDGLEKVLN